MEKKNEFYNTLIPVPLFQNKYPEHIEKEGIAIRDAAMSGDFIAMKIYQDWLKDHDELGDLAFWMKCAEMQLSQRNGIPLRFLRGIDERVLSVRITTTKSPPVHDPQVREVWSS